MRRVERGFSGIGAGAFCWNDRLRDLALADSIYRSDMTARACLPDRGRFAQTYNGSNEALSGSEFL